MKYYFTISTGDKSISGSLSDTIYRNTEADFFSSQLFYNQNIITGRHCSLISLNSQVLLEETPVHVNGVNTVYDYIFTGDYFLTPDDENYSAALRMGDGIAISNNDLLIYDRRDFSTGIACLKQTTDSIENDTLQELGEKINAIDPSISNIPQLFANYDIFLNGQKLIIDEYPSDLTTGKLFAIKKKQKIIDIASDYPDLYGSVLFVENQVDYYINGMEQLESEFIQLYTGTTFIQTGVNCFIDFVSYEENNYNL